MKIEIKATVIIDDDFINWDDKDQLDWFTYEVLKSGEVSILSNEIGDTIGEVIDIDWCIND